MTDTLSDVAPVTELPPLAPGAIEIKPRAKTAYNVRLVGKDYRALPQKTMVAIGMAKKLDAAGEDVDQLLLEIESWMASIFGRKVAPEIMARLSDGEDDLDLPDVMDLIRQLSEKATANPTT